MAHYLIYSREADRKRSCAHAQNMWCTVPYDNEYATKHLKNDLQANNNTPAGPDLMIGQAQGEINV